MNQELIEKALDQIISDVVIGDVTAIEELLKKIPEHLLVDFLIEGE
jgi:hypothetical protein